MADERLYRRQALKVIAAGTAGALPVAAGGALARGGVHGHPHPHAAAEPPVPAPPKFFGAAELVAVSALAEAILPADERSPGATEAGVPGFIDLMVAESPKETQALWRDGLRALDARCRRRSGHDFASVSPEERAALLGELARHERRPRTLVERLFRAAKSLTLDGYYTSEIGIHRELRYQGNAYLKEFKGCTHPEHQQ